MKKLSCFSIIFIGLIVSCNRSNIDLNELIKKGEFTKAGAVIDEKLQNKNRLSAYEIEFLSKQKNDMLAIKNEYTKSHNEVFKELKEKIADLTEEDMHKWEKDYTLEYYLIEGQKKYYTGCVFDLFQVNKEAAQRAGIEDDTGYDASKYPLETINAFAKDSAFSKKINVAFSYFQNLDVIPRGDILRVWIPYVRENKYQTDIQIIEKNIENITLPDKNNLTQMLYFEHKVINGYNSHDKWKRFFEKPKYDWMYSIKKPEFVTDSTFLLQFVYKYNSKAYYNKINPATIKPYDAKDSNYQKYTKERVYNQFTDYLKGLSKDIIGKETNSYLKAKLIYKWICKNITWTSPKAVLGDYAEYTAKYKRGDCAAKSNLFISLCRINDIPARAQGGWIVRPNQGHAQHSWAQVYFAPYGWLPVDVTLGKALIDNPDDRLEYFYFGNCTPYHLVIYDDDPDIIPQKEFPCLTGGGAQLGVFQWKGGDLEPFIKIDSYVEKE